MPQSLWITYAWADNADGDFDHLVNELRRAGIETRFDRVELVPGQRLWEQIGERIRAADLGGWAYLVTPNSLASQSCKEELAYALDRALAAKGEGFPLLGLLHGVNANDLPLPLRIRLCVPVGSPGWTDSVKAALERRPAPQNENETTAVKVKWHQNYRGQSRRIALEFTPRFGEMRYWRIAFPGVGPQPVDKGVGPAGGGGFGGLRVLVIDGSFVDHGRSMNCVGAEDPLSPYTSAYLVFQDSMPEQIWFGCSDDPTGLPTNWQVTTFRAG